MWILTATGTKQNRTNGIKQNSYLGMQKKMNVIEVMLKAVPHLMEHSIELTGPAFGFDGAKSF